MAKVRYLTMEPLQENPLMQLPISTSFISRFVVEPLCYKRSGTFAGNLLINKVRYSCILTGGFLNGEEIMRSNYSDQRIVSVPITAVRNEEYIFCIFIISLN
jgi:hypothetical protein